MSPHLHTHSPPRLRRAGRGVLSCAVPARHSALHWWVTGMHRITWALLRTAQPKDLSSPCPMEQQAMPARQPQPSHPSGVQGQSVGAMPLGRPPGQAGSRVLDVGCGPGWDLAALPEGLFGVGLDRVMTWLGCPPLVQGDAERLPFAAGAFDLVLALDLLEQEDLSPDQALREACRVLRPGGSLLVRVPAQPWLYGPHDRTFGGARRYRRQELGAMVEDAGFRISRLTYANSLLFPAEAISRLLQRAGIISGDDLCPVPGPVNRCLTWALALEAHWLVTHDLPFGLSLLCLAERPA